MILYASIPMNGKTNSLNASVSAGIIIYEAVSQRKWDNLNYRDFNDYEILSYINENNEDAK